MNATTNAIPPLVLRHRIVSAVLIISILAMAGVLWVIIDQSLLAHKRHEHEQQEVTFAVVSELAKHALAAGDYEQLQRHLVLLKTDPHIGEALVTDTEGLVVASIDPTREGKPLRGLGGTGRWVSQPILMPDDRAGTVAINYRDEQAEEAFRKARNAGIAVGIFSILALTFGGVLAGAMLTRRLAQLSRAVQGFTDGDYHSRAPQEGKDEIADLGRTFNAMADALERKFEELREAESVNQRNFLVQRITASILRTSQEPIPLTHQLEKALDLLLQLPWFSGPGFGAAILTQAERSADFQGRVSRGMRDPGENDCPHSAEGCVCRQVADSLQPQFVSDAQAIGACMAEPKPRYVLPVIARGRVFGVLCVQLRPGHARSEVEESLLGTVASTLGGILDRNRTAERIRTLSRAVEQNPASIIITDTSGRIEYVNPKFTEVTGYTLDEVQGRNPSILKSGSTNGDVYRHLWQTIQRGMEWCGEFCNRKKNGELFWEYASISGIRSENGEISNFVAVKEDITERKRVEEHNLYLLRTDPLTELPNRFRFTQLLDETLEARRDTGGKLALLIVNPIRFREINDTLGHDTGDRILKEMAKRVQQACAKAMHDMHLDAEPVVARLTGDEFAVIIQRLADDHDANLIGQLLADAMEAPYLIAEHLIEINPSIGLAISPTHGDDTTTLMRRTDIAMQRAKSHHTSLVVYSREIDNYSPRRLAIIAELRQAILSDALRLVYQPKLDLASGRVVSVEALLRWQQGEHGAVSPAEFIPLAERSGLIRPLTQWVLNEALKENRRWAEAGVHLGVAVNLSAMNLADRHLPGVIQDLLEAWETPAGALSLEITETAVMSDPSTSLAVLTQLHAMGIRISIDDYGSGYSSLAYIKELPIDELKIDQSFVKHMVEVSKDEMIVRSTIGLAHNLGLGVIAEGVEDQRTLERLRALGCDCVQGYFISRPISGDQLLRKLADLHDPEMRLIANG